MTRAAPLLVALALAGCGKPPAATPGLLPPGFAIATKAIVLPDDRAALPAGSGNELIAQHCTGCHSSEMLTTQPRLDAKTWAAEIAKMRTLYHAPIDPGDDAALVAALMALPSQRDAPR